MAQPPSFGDIHSDETPAADMLIADDAGVSTIDDETPAADMLMTDDAGVSPSTTRLVSYLSCLCWC